MHGRERRELAVTEAMMPMMMQGQLPIAPFDTGAAALEQVGTFRGHLLKALALVGGERLEGLFGLAQGLEQLGTQCPQRAALRGVGAAIGHAVEINGGD
jgi:hypothetical protein